MLDPSQTTDIRIVLELLDTMGNTMLSLGTHIQGLQQEVEEHKKKWEERQFIDLHAYIHALILNRGSSLETPDVALTPPPPHTQTSPSFIPKDGKDAHL